MFERPDYAVLGQTRYDQSWIDSNTEAGVAACGWQRPKARPPELGRPPAAKHLAPTKKKRPGLIGRIKRPVAPSLNAESSAPAVQVPEPPAIPAAPVAPRDPMDELLESNDAPPAKPPRRRCWWC